MSSGNVGVTAVGWFGLGLGAGLLIPILAGRSALRVIASLNPWILRGSVAAIAALSIALILITDKTAAPTAPMSAASPLAPGAAASPGTGGSMEAATATLAARLAAKGGTDEDWKLLAQSYDFLGRTEEAKQAREHKVSPQRSLQDAMAATAPVRPGSSMPALMPQSVTPVGAGAALLAQADEHRRKREFKQACDVYRKVIAAGGMTADAWADYADALASSVPGGSLSGEPAKAIDQALAIDPQHAKALWLKASLAHEERRYQDAVATWRKLLALMPPGSSDARIIETNLAEAERLAGSKG